jgi:hypothetical protein
MDNTTRLTYFTCPICHKQYLDCHETACENCPLFEDDGYEGLCNEVDNCEHDPSEVLAYLYADNVQLREDLAISLGDQIRLRDRIVKLEKKHQFYKMTHFHKLYGGPGSDG